MKISARFVVDMLAVLGGAFLIVATMAFGAGATGWLGFGVSTAVLVAAAVGALASGRLDARIGGATLGVVAAWSLIAALVFSGTAMTWLVFADALAILAIGVVDLVVHEARTERVVHQLEVREYATAA
ncbi:hypothetical protein [Sciscionella marina]|uniref:hypothetical protein n=1 Tax=Sciscionella marina TaxID=508770 RepID=UPI000362A44C|nr:hypothetical protein [Sciscionella marina]